ncbi:unnamed protein product [Sphagnum tenellum]
MSVVFFMSMKVSLRQLWWPWCRFWTLIQQSEVLLVLAQGRSITDLVSNLSVDCCGKGDDKVPNCIVWWCDAGCTFQHAEADIGTAEEFFQSGTFFFNSPQRLFSLGSSCGNRKPITRHSSSALAEKRGSVQIRGSEIFPSSVLCKKRGSEDVEVINCSIHPVHSV